MRKQLGPEDREYRIVYVTQIQPHPANANNSDAEALEKSLALHGSFRSVVVQKSTNYILAGNGTWAAACETGIKQLPIEVIDVDDDQAVEVMVADNQIARLAVMDKGLLARLVRDQPIPDLPAFGFDQTSLAKLLESIDKPLAPLKRNFVLEFSSDEEIEAWQGFLRHLKEQYPDEVTTGARVVAFVRDYDRE